MNEVKRKVEDCVRQIRQRTEFVPRVALILGSGLGALAEQIHTEAVVEYADIEGFPVSTVSGHRGRFVFGHMGDTPVVIMQGRVHYYEGYDISDVVLPVRVMKLLGAEILFLTCAVGGLKSTLKPGDLLMLTDQISSFVPSPLIGANVEEWGPRFPSMDTIYDRELCQRIRNRAQQCGIALQEGIYVQTTGPNYESPAEVRLYALLGGDVVGMSTAVEAVTACHMGMRVCGIACVTNLAGGTDEEPLSHEEVSAAADKAAPLFQKLVTEAIVDMGK